MVSILSLYKPQILHIIICSFALLYNIIVYNQKGPNELAILGGSSHLKLFIYAAISSQFEQCTIM